MKKVLVLVILTIITISPTFATHWIQIDEKVYFDIDSIEQYVDDNGNEVPNQYVFWSKNLNDGSDVYILLEKIYNKKVWYSLDKNIIDIDKKSYTTKMGILYDLKGHVIESFNYEEDWDDIPPDSIGDIEYKMIYIVLMVGKSNAYKILKELK